MPTMTEQGRAWASSGAMALTGRADGTPLVAPDRVVDRIRALGAPVDVDPLPLLGERAAIAGLRRRGDVSCDGRAHLLPAVGGWVAVSLARDDDVAAVPAWLEVDLADVDARDPWAVVADTVARMPVDTVVERGVLLGLPVAAVPQTPGVEEAPVRAQRVGDGQTVRDRPLVVDLSSLWAGPLCARLLRQGGARVVKVEFVTRPDGARSGPAAFFDLFHYGHESVAFDLTHRSEIERLQRLLRAADIVIEASRPRALEQLGVTVANVLADGPVVWVSITGHGRTRPERDRVAFGDDAAAGGGLVALDAIGPCFVADAVADPLSGVAAAAAVKAALDAGGRWLIDVAMTRVAAHVAGTSGSQGGEAWRPGDKRHAEPPRAPIASGPGPTLGEHTDAVLAEVAR